MAANFTRENSTETDLGLVIFGGVGYAVEGLLIGLGNLLIACAIAKYEALRSLNQYILLMTLAFGDGFNMMGYAAAGIYRLQVTFAGQLDRLLTPLECVLRPHVLIWMLGDTISAMMLVVLSADRLFLVAFPETYLLSLPNPGYAKGIVAFIFLFMSSMFLVGVAAAVSTAQNATEHVFCFVPSFLASTDSILSSIFIFHVEKVLASMALASILIFMLIVPVQKYRTGQQGGVLGAQEVNSQKRMTKSVALSCLCSLLLYLIPHRIAFWAWHKGYMWLSRCMALILLTNPLANCFIYPLRHAEVRIALRGLLQWKAMPANLNVWTAQNIVVPARREQI